MKLTESKLREMVINMLKFNEQHSVPPGDISNVSDDFLLGRQARDFLLDAIDDGDASKKDIDEIYKASLNYLQAKQEPTTDSLKNAKKTLFSAIDNGFTRDEIVTLYKDILDYLKEHIKWN